MSKNLKALFGKKCDKNESLLVSIDSVDNEVTTLMKCIFLKSTYCFWVLFLKKHILFLGAFFKKAHCRMSKVVIIHPDIYRSKRDAILLESFSSDVIPIKYNDKMTKEELFTAIGDTGNVTSVKQVAFLYHYPGFYRLPFFYDNIHAGLPERPTDLENVEKMEKYREQLEAYKPVTPKYTYWSDTVIDIIRELKDGRTEDLKSGEFIVDVLCCDLNNTKYKEEVLKIEEDLGINIRFSVDKTGNNASGGNWVMESESFIVNVQRDYFTDRVLEWKGVLADDISVDIKNGDYDTYITWNNSTNTYTVVQDFLWTDLGVDSTDYIGLLANETFDGNGKTIDLTGITRWLGLFTSSATSFPTSPLIKNLGMIGGNSLASNAGYIVRQSQLFFMVDNCYNTGNIRGGSSGGIAGVYAGESGKCTITNCYNTGNFIGAFCGGIAGAYAGIYSGECTITNCYNIGNMYGISDGGIVGGYAGTFSGNCTIENCYNTGNITGGGSGGIAGSNTGSYSGKCNITNCYNIGNIYNEYSGGIVGTTDSYFVNCNILGCVTNGPPYIRNGIANIINCSQDLSVINNSLYGWPLAFWVSGDAVPTVSNYRLPILLAFQALPWIFTSSDPEYYNQATDPAQFYEEPPILQTPTPTPSIQMTIPPCCTVNICTKNPQETNYDNTNITNNLTGRAIANNVAEIQNSGNNGRIYSQPVFKTYYQYMIYLQSKHR